MLYLTVIAASAAPGDENWETFPIPEGLNGGVVRFLPFKDHLYAAGEFTEADGKPANGIAAWDGSHWSPVGTGLVGEVVALATDGKKLYVGGMFVIPDLAITNLAVWDGDGWQAIGNASYRGPQCGPTARVLALAYGAGRLAVGGLFDTVGGLSATNIATLRGHRWETLDGGIGGTCDDSGIGFVNCIALMEDRIYAGGTFHHAGRTIATNIACWNGAKWQSLGSGLASSGVGEVRVNYEDGMRVFYSGSVQALAFTDGRLIAGGDFTVAGDKVVRGLAEWDGHSWSERFGPVDGVVRAIWRDEEALVVAGGFGHAGTVTANNIARFDKHHWSALGSGLSAATYALQDWNGSLFAAGGFGIAGKVSSPFVARWSNAHWHSLHEGKGLGVFGIITGIADTGLEVDVTGLISSAGSQRVQNVASWNGETWKTFGAGIHGVPQDIARVGSNVFVSANFSVPPIGISAFNARSIIRWDGQSWDALTSPSITGQFILYALASDSTTLYANSVGAETGVFAWDGESWSKLGENFAGLITYIVARDGRIAASGNLQGPGNYSTVEVALWDGSGWSGLGNVISGYGPTRMAFFHGTLYIVVFDLQTGLWTVQGWDPSLSEWSTIATLTGSLDAIGANDHFLYVAGSFDRIGDVEARNIARFDGANWLPLGSGLDGYGYPLAVSANRVAVGGNFTKAGTRSSYHLAIWHEPPP